MEAEIEYYKKLKNNYLEICNSEFKHEEYYYVIIGVDYDSYDNIFMTKTDIYVDVPKVMNVKKKGFLGFTWETKEEVLTKERVGIYAIRTKSGIYEMTTGRGISLTGNNNAINCFGINRVTDNCLDDIAKDLKLLDSNPRYKEQFINSLMTLSNYAYNKIKRFEEIERQKRADINYLKSYKLPNGYNKR